MNKLIALSRYATAPQQPLYTLYYIVLYYIIVLEKPITSTAPEAAEQYRAKIIPHTHTLVHTRTHVLTYTHAHKHTHTYVRIWILPSVKGDPRSFRWARVGPCVGRARSTSCNNILYGNGVLCARRLPMSFRRDPKHYLCELWPESIKYIVQYD